MQIILSGSSFEESKKKLGEMGYCWLSFRHNHGLNWRLCVVPLLPHRRSHTFTNENFTEAASIKCSSSNSSQRILMQIWTWLKVKTPNRVETIGIKWECAWEIGMYGHPTNILYLVPDSPLQFGPTSAFALHFCTSLWAPSNRFLTVHLCFDTSLLPNTKDIF